VSTAELDPVIEALAAGEVVALPTETVYGLAARADLPQAVEAIFRAKERPSDNPLIVHAADAESALSLGRAVPGYARRLADRFWPGPLSLVLESAREWPWVQAGHSTIAVRVPEPRYLREVIRRVGPLAAPSANRSGRPSPTTADHCLQDLDGRVPLIVDGGHAPGGMESTVVDCTGAEPVILRPGPVTAEDVQAVVDDGAAESFEGRGRVTGQAGPGTSASPGTRHPHYRPRARVVLVDDLKALDRRLASPDVAEAMTIGPVLTHARHPRRWDTLEELARHLYAWFREADDLGVSVIYVERVPDEGLGAALMNRVTKAAAPADY
jgi:L-threonylcarbamoyladenylate synthase